jgi:pilus assembly protein Flp/PilA
MNRLVNMIRTFGRKDEGQDLVEYALLVALVALGSVAAVTLAGGKINSVFQAIVSNIPVPAA